MGLMTEASSDGVRPAVWFGWSLVAVVVLSLFVTLATRTFPINVSHGVAIQSDAAQCMQQHLDRDAANWVPAVLSSTILQAPTFYPHLAPAGPPLVVLLLDENLYNRPPPSC